MVDDPRRGFTSPGAGTLIVNHFIIVGLGRESAPTRVSILPLPDRVGHGDRLPAVLRLVRRETSREAAVIDGYQRSFSCCFRVFLPMNWGVTTALGTHLRLSAPGTNFLWPFQAATWTRRPMTESPSASGRGGIARRGLSRRLLLARYCCGLPVAAAYLLFQRRVIRPSRCSAGIGG